MTNEELARELVYLNAKISMLTLVLANLLADSVRTADGKDLSELLAELIQKLPKGYTERIAALHDGQRDALTDLSRMIDQFSNGKTTVTFGGRRSRPSGAGEVRWKLKP